MDFRKLKMVTFCGVINQISSSAVKRLRIYRDLTVIWVRVRIVRVWVRVRS